MKSLVTALIFAVTSENIISTNLSIGAYYISKASQLTKYIYATTPTKLYICQLLGGRYKLVLSAPQWAYLSKLDVMHNPDVMISKQDDGSVVLHMKQEDYSMFLNSTATNKPKANLTLSIDDIITGMDPGELNVGYTNTEYYYADMQDFNTFFI